MWHLNRHLIRPVPTETSSQPADPPAAPDSRDVAADWKSPLSSFHVNISRPDLGLAEKRFQQQPGLTESGILQCHFADPAQPLEPVRHLELEEAYVRGNDLVATYASEDDPIRRQIYWRHLGDVAGVEMIVSIQNQLLTGQPALRVRSQFTADSVWRMTNEQRFVPVQETSTDSGSDYAGVAVVGLSSNWVFLEMVHPSDYRSSAVRIGDNSVDLEWSLFGDRIEKGVIRRARLRGEFVCRREFEDVVRHQTH